MIERSTNRSLLVVGSVAQDTIDGPFGKQEYILGGSGSFFGIAASYFTKNVSMIGVVGDDFEEEHVEFFNSCGIDTSGLQRAEGKTFHWHGKYADDLATRETIDTQLGVFADFDPKLNDKHRESELLFLGNIHPVLQQSVLEQVGKPKLVALDTMDLWIRTERENLVKTLERVDTFIINDEEARQLSGKHNLVHAARHIMDMGPHSIVIKRGDAGALLFYGEGNFFAAALPLADVRDPTGAGDSFAGGFMGYLAYTGNLDPESIRAAMIYGSVMGSFSVEQFSVDGLRNLTPKLIRERFDSFYELSRFDRIHL